VSNLSQNHYEVLGVKRDATEDDIKTAYRTQAKRWHPDVCKEPGAEEKFKEIGAAYVILVDSEARQKYNTLLDMAAGRHVGMEDFLKHFHSAPPAAPPERKRTQRRGRRRQGQGDPEVEDLPGGFLREGRGRDSFFDDSLGGIL
jgi:DnaJ-class molecular chaperone